MKKMMIFAVLVIVSMTAFAQVSKEEQELIDLSNQKWVWMAEKNADRLAELFLDNAQFVHMGGGWGKQQEVDIIRGGMIWYKHADIHSQEVKFTDKNVGTVYSNIHLTSEVGGHQVRFPFMVCVFNRKNARPSRPFCMHGRKIREHSAVRARKVH